VLSRSSLLLLNLESPMLQTFYSAIADSLVTEPNQLLRPAPTPSIGIFARSGFSWQPSSLLAKSSPSPPPTSGATKTLAPPPLLETAFRVYAAERAVVFEQRFPTGVAGFGGPQSASCEHTAGKGGPAQLFSCDWYLWGWVAAVAAWLRKVVTVSRFRRASS
jgi:hypothetical protein